MTVPVIDLDADQQGFFNVELLDGILTTPRQRRLEFRAAFENKLEPITLKRSKGKKDGGAGSKFPIPRRAKIDYALKDLDKAWRGGMDEDLKDKSVQEILRLLLPGCGSKQMRGHKKMTTSRLKKDCNLLPWFFSFAVVFSLFAVDTLSAFPSVFQMKIKQIYKTTQHTNKLDNNTQINTTQHVFVSPCSCF